MVKPIYIDLDNTLGVGVEARGNLVFEVRPDAPWFVDAMSRYGDLWLLSWATRDWIRDAFAALGRTASRFRGVISREDLQVVRRQMDVVEDSPGLSDGDRRDLYRQIGPIAPPGVVFDDFPFGSEFHRMKSLAVGTFFMPHGWIRVESYGPGGPDGGLRKAYREFQRRNDIWRGRASGRGTRPMAGVR